MQIYTVLWDCKLIWLIFLCNIHSTTISSGHSSLTRGCGVSWPPRQSDTAKLIVSFTTKITSKIFLLPSWKYFTLAFTQILTGLQHLKYCILIHCKCKGFWQVLPDLDLLFFVFYSSILVLEVRFQVPSSSSHMEVLWTALSIGHIASLWTSSSVLFCCLKFSFAWEKNLNTFEHIKLVTLMHFWSDANGGIHYRNAYTSTITWGRNPARSSSSQEIKRNEAASFCVSTSFFSICWLEFFHWPSG